MVRQVRPQALCPSPRASSFQLTYLIQEEALPLGDCLPHVWPFQVEIARHPCLLISGVWPFRYTGRLYKHVIRREVGRGSGQSGRWGEAAVSPGGGERQRSVWEVRRGSGQSGR